MKFCNLGFGSVSCVSEWGVCFNFRLWYSILVFDVAKALDLIIGIVLFFDFDEL